MKKISGIVFVLLALVAGFVLSRQSKEQVPARRMLRVTDSENAAVTPTEAVVPHDSKPQRAAQSARLSSEPIPMIDPTDPALTTFLDSLTRSFESTIKRSPVSRAYTREQIKERARLLAVARLSQSMYEASIAAVVTTPDSASISIPVYRKDGEWLKAYVFGTVIAEYQDQETKIAIRNTFAYFGQYPQQLKVQASDGRAEPPFDDLRFWSICSDIDFGGGEHVIGNSTLDVSHLAHFAPFAGWFPKL